MLCNQVLLVQPLCIPFPPPNSFSIRFNFVLASYVRLYFFLLLLSQKHIACSIKSVVYLPNDYPALFCSICPVCSLSHPLLTSLDSAASRAQLYFMLVITLNFANEPALLSCLLSWLTNQPAPSDPLLCLHGLLPL
jgi:hypothetical protein